MNYKDTHTVKFGVFKPVCIWANNNDVHLGLPLFYDHPDSSEFSRDLGIFNQGTEAFEKQHNVTLPITVDQYNEIFQDEKGEPPSIPSRMPYYPMLPPRTSEFRDYKEYIQKGERFIMNVIVDDANFFYKHINGSVVRPVDNFEIPEDLLTALSNHQCTLVFDQIREGHFQTSVCVEFMQNFARKFGLTPNNFYILSGNAQAEAMCHNYASVKGEELLFTPVNSFHFEDTFWFTDNSDKFGGNQRTKHYTYFNKMLDHKLHHPPEKHFLCLNRRLDVHRMAIFSEFQINPELKDKVLLSLGNCYGVPQHEAETWVENVFKTTDKYEQRKEFFKNYDFSQNYTLDREDFHRNFAEILPTELHQKTFAPVVTETLRDDRAIFFSEKTFRPIFCAQPFFILGNRGMIHRLREMGYKTFDKWWDESYDLENSWQRRFNKLYKVLEEVSKFTTTDLYYIQKEMEDTLTHNFNVLLSKKRYRRIQGIFSRNTKPFSQII